MLGGSGELLLLDLGGGGSSTVLVDGLLRLIGILSSIVLESLGCISGLLRGEIFDLIRLLGGHLAGVFELSIDSILVLNVYKRAEVGNRGGDQSQAPERNELDEEVGDQRSKECLHTIMLVSSSRQCQIQGV